MERKSEQFLKKYKANTNNEGEMPLPFQRHNLYTSKSQALANFEILSLSYLLKSTLPSYTWENSAAALIPEYSLSTATVLQAGGGSVCVWQ